MFTASKLRGVYTLMSKKSKELVERIKKENEKKNKIDMRVRLKKPF